jgi:TrmH family RNA methyltransferase
MLGIVPAMSPRAVIRSRANADLKRVGAVREGRSPGLLLLEGERLVEEALERGLELELLLVGEGRLTLAARFEARGQRVRLIADELLDRASALTTSPGILALCAVPDAPDPSTLAPGARSLVLVEAGVSDPGNLGALARSAEAAGASALVVVAGGASPWSDKALRGSMGSLLRLPVHRFESADEVVAALARHRHVRAATRNGQPAFDFDWSGPIALWVGSEAGALPEVCEPFERVTIPMAGGVESLNVTVAASLLLFAAGRSS